MAQIIKKGPSYMVRITWYDADGKQHKKSKSGFKTKVQARQYANGDLQATRTSNGWTFSGDGYTATVGDDGSISHN